MGLIGLASPLAKADSRCAWRHDWINDVVDARLDVATRDQAPCSRSKAEILPLPWGPRHLLRVLSATVLFGFGELLYI
ncbi:MAG: hypothetical protein JWR21_3706 [Herminiimonas sp.]|nr:hypothetical protein [Herminiimonas sp.]